MKSSASLRSGLLFLLIVVAVPGSPLARGAEEPVAPARSTGRSDEPLVITEGTFIRDGRKIPATVRNVVEFVRLRYPNVNITLIDVDDVIVDHLTLQWGRYREREAAAGAFSQSARGAHRPAGAAAAHVSRRAGRGVHPDEKRMIRQRQTAPYSPPFRPRSPAFSQNYFLHFVPTRLTARVT